MASSTVRCRKHRGMISFGMRTWGLEGLVGGRMEMRGRAAHEADAVLRSLRHQSHMKNQTGVTSSVRTADVIAHRPATSARIPHE